MKTEKEQRKIAILGLGYAGLHTALAFQRVKSIIGFDCDESRIDELKQRIDRHGEFSKEEFGDRELQLTCDPQDIADRNFYIVIVPTPITEGNFPDFSYLVDVSILIGGMLKPGDIVVYESTVYPGATNEICLPILEMESDLVLGKDFAIGYSPERINPGDKIHTFLNTVKIVAASDAAALKIIAAEYASIVEKGVFLASSIEVAEAAKIIENIQRDTNIALMNELAQFFKKINIDTTEVIRAASTKWNFIPFHPGFVGGHCISVDPYYILYKASLIHYSPYLIQASRKTNEQLSHFIADETIKLLVKRKLIKTPTKIAIFGITYKEDYDDVRNNKVVDLSKHLEAYGIEVIFYDPVASEESAFHEFGIELSAWGNIPTVSAIIIAVGHKKFKALSCDDYQKKLDPKGFIMDVKSVLNVDEFKSSDLTVWRL
ncbi:MAG: nucleotide sugar dehydrogenase [Gammaproteobacteria bacterium]|nr:nucleotide sugar dehydrogenase [Gammaproteobacteria bacterium]